MLVLELEAELMLFEAQPCGVIVLACGAVRAGSTTEGRWILAITSLSLRDFETFQIFERVLHA